MGIAQRWTGREAAALRQARRMSIRAYAAHLGVAVATVTNWDARGEQARLRTETQQLLDIDLARAPGDVRARFEAVLADAGKVTEHPGPRGPAEAFGSRRTGGVLDADSDHQSVVAAMHAFRLADSQFGGAELYPAVVAYLQSQIGPRLVGGIDEISTPAAFNAGASMLEMAGWMAHDRGDDQTAQNHFNRALAFTAVGDDEHLRAQVLGSMSHLAAHLGRPHETIRLARQGQDVLGQAPPHSPLAARLLALEARGAAGLGDTGRPLELLARAESELDKRGSLGQPPSPWLSQYDRASLASDAGRCLLRLGDLSEARREAELIIELRPARRARSRGLGQLALATVLVAQGALDEASVVAEQTLDSDLPVQSAPITRGLRTLHEKLAPHRTNIKAAKIHVRLTVTLQQRDSLHGQGRPVRIRPDA